MKIILRKFQMAINRKAFFDAVRSSGVAGKALTQYTVDSLGAILDGFESLYPKASLPQIAYVMATARHEAWDAKKQSIRYDVEEFGGASRSYGKTGFYGRGLAQLTHEANYKKAGEKLGVDLVGNPKLALRKDISAKILIMGSMLGWFRGDSQGRHSLPRYFTSVGNDPVEARNIINGDEAKNGKLVASHYNHFLSALNKAAQAAPTKEPAPMPVPNQVPIPTDRNVNPEQLAGALRQLLLLASGSLGTYLVTKGYVTTDTWKDLSPLLAPIFMAAGTAVWGWVARTDKNLVKSAADVPAVTEVVVNSAQPLPSRAPIVEAATADVPALSAEEIAAGWKTVRYEDLPLRDQPLSKIENELPDVLKVLLTLGQIAAPFAGPAGAAALAAANALKAAHDDR
jgi:putative chitinase